MIMIFNLFLLFSLFSLNFASDPIYDEFGLTALHNAILYDRIKTIKTLIDKKLFINTPDLASNATPLHLLVEKIAVQKQLDEQNQTVRFIETLVAYKVDEKVVVDRAIQTDSGWTALNKAVYLASDLPDYPLDVIKILLKDCVAVDKVTNKKTVLHYAASSRIKPDRATVLVNLLMEHCASKIDYDARDANDWTALKTAIAAENYNVAAALSPKTSSISFVMKIGFLIVVLTLIFVAFAIYYFFKISRKPELIVPASDNDNVSEKTSSPPEITSEIDSTTFYSKEKMI